MATAGGDSDSESNQSMTPSETSDMDLRSEHDSDYETDDDDDSNVVWTGFGRKIPIITFDADAVLNKRESAKTVGQRYRMTFKMESADCRIIRSILGTHGFKEVTPSGVDYNIMWTGSQLKPFILRGMADFQRVNHFPRSYEITRKDRLYRNIQRMQQAKGVKHFDFVAHSYILPADYQEFCSAFLKDKGLWIVKPVASSRGRGVYLISHPEQVSLDENLIVSRYIPNPLLIDSFKFDIRLYVAVTSYDPIVVYLFEEGLTRFATVKYNRLARYMTNQCMHLTNYSVNKKNKDYVKNDDPDIEDYGNKWSFGALLRYLKSIGHDTSLLMSRIEAVVIKTIIAGEMPIATACRMFMPFRSNCFELYGFDILVDENFKPWVLEVNLSPSLACDSPLDLKIKANMLCDLLTLSGLVCHDPVLKNINSRKNIDTKYLRSKSSTSRSSMSTLRERPQSAGSVPRYRCNPDRAMSKITSGLNSEEIKIVRRVREERERNLLQFNTTHNLMLHQRLYPDRHTGTPLVTSIKQFGANHPSLRTKRSNTAASKKTKVEAEEESQLELENRTKQYLRMLGDGQKKTRRRRRARPSAMIGGLVRQTGMNLRLLDEEGEEEDAEDPVVVPPTTTPTSTQVPHPPPTPTTVHICDTAPEEEVQRLDLVALLVQGHALSKVEARRAFAMYLIRVQQRLMNDNDHSATIDLAFLNEQMDLVLRFLKRAAVNLQQHFKVIVPSHKLPIPDRRRILAKQLGDFVHIYNKETETIQNKKQTDKPHHTIDGKMFSHFITTASENELEEVLTTYTQIHKSASIFLGGDGSNKSRPPSANRPATSATSHARVQSAISRQSSATNAWTNDTAPKGDDPTTTTSGYNHRLEKVVGVRPSEYYNEVAINEALARLTTRQQARQYSSVNSSSNLCGQGDEPVDTRGRSDKQTLDPRTRSVSRTRSDGKTQFDSKQISGIPSDCTGPADLAGPSNPSGQSCPRVTQPSPVTSLRLRSWSVGDVTDDVTGSATQKYILPDQYNEQVSEKYGKIKTEGSKPPVGPMRKAHANHHVHDVKPQYPIRHDQNRRSSSVGPKSAGHTRVTHYKDSRLRDAKSTQQLKRYIFNQNMKSASDHIPRDMKPPQHINRATELDYSKNGPYSSKQQRNERTSSYTVSDMQPLPYTNKIDNLRMDNLRLDSLQSYQASRNLFTPKPAVEIKSRPNESKSNESKSNAPPPSTWNTNQGGGDHKDPADDPMKRHRQLMDQSRALLENSRSKHQAMVAQAHAAQRALMGPGMYVPAPPPPRSQQHK